MFTAVRAQVGVAYKSGLNRIERATNLLSRKPEELGQLRYRAILLSTLTTCGGRAVSVLVNIVSVPLAAQYLGLERYGLWLVASSLIGWLGLSDLGMGNQLTTTLAQASGRDDQNAARAYVSTTLRVLVGIALAVGLASVTAWPFIPWDRLFNVRDAVARAEAPVVAALVLLFTLANLPLSLTSRIYCGYQEGWKANLWQIAGSLASLVALFIAVRGRAGLPGLAVAIAGTPILVLGINLLYLWAREKPWLFSWREPVRWEVAREVAAGGFWMFLVNLQAIFWLGKDNLLIGQLLGPAKVGSFNVTFRIYFLLLGLLAGSVAASMWPAYAEAIARNDWDWIKRAFNRSLVTVLSLYAGAALIISFLAHPIIRVWAGANLVPATALPWALAAEFFVLAWINVLSYLVMAAQQSKVIAITGLVAGVVGVALAVPLVRPFGMVAIPIANTIACAVFMLLPLQLTVTRLFVRSAPVQTDRLAGAHPK